MYRRDYRPLITLPHTALRKGSCRHTACALGFRGGRPRRRTAWRALAYAVLPRRRATPYSVAWARGRQLTARSRAREGHLCGVAGQEVCWIHAAMLLIPSSSPVSTAIPTRRVEERHGAPGGSVDADPRRSGKAVTVGPRGRRAGRSGRRHRRHRGLGARARPRLRHSSAAPRRCSAPHDIQGSCSKGSSGFGTPRVRGSRHRY